MGIYLLPYGTKIDKVKSSFNSKDEKLFAEIQKTRTYDCYASQDENYPVKIKDALKHILFGDIKNKEFPPAYVYALMTIVDHFGEELTPEGDVFKFGTINKNIENKLKEFDVFFSINELIEPIYQFEIPNNFNKFPFIGGISKNELENLLSRLNGIEISKEAINWEKNGYNHELEAIHILRRAAKFCLDNDFDWISFAH